MIMAMNMGNTHFAMGWQEQEGIRVVQHATKELCTTHDFVSVLRQTSCKVSGIILSSVVPAATEKIIKATQTYCGMQPIQVHASMSMHVNLQAYDKTQIGNDRIAVCEGALAKYKTPIIIFDFGTATTMNVLDAHGLFLGGVIFAGVTMGLAALSSGTAQLPVVAPQSTVPLLGQNTKDNLLAGAMHGNAALLDGMVDRVLPLLSDSRNRTVLLTGGNAKYVMPFCKTAVVYEPHLLMKGLFCLYEKNMNPEKNNEIQTHLL